MLYDELKTHTLKLFLSITYLPYNYANYEMVLSF